VGKKTEKTFAREWDRVRERSVAVEERTQYYYCSGIAKRKTQKQGLGFLC
jgi:hypothetical protein